MSEQLSFAPPARPRPRIPYKGRAPHTKGSDTSREAAEAIESIRGRLEYDVWRFLVSMKGYGATDEEGAEATGLPGNTYRPRRRYCEELGLVKKTDMRRPTKAGRTAAVYVAT